MAAQAYVFDAYGTLFDVHSVRHVAEDLYGKEKAEIVSQVWRQKQLEYSWLRSLMNAYEDFWSVTRSALEYALKAAGVGASNDATDRLMEKYCELELYPEVYEALGRLSTAKLAILSNGSPEMLERLVSRSKIAPLMNAIISVDSVKTFKPDPKTYSLIESALDMQPKRVVFVSSNSFDIAGAKHFGCRTAWIRRVPVQPSRGDFGPDRIHALLRSRGEELGLPAEIRLPNLLSLSQIGA
jgi:2-haloacid dehalogenase